MKGENTREKILYLVHYYQIKAKIKRFVYLTKLKQEDAEKKRKIDKAITSLSNIEFGDNDLIVSLTSYGHRITDSLPYTLFSLVSQDLVPNKIEVFISENEYGNIQELPIILQKFASLGITFNFVEDIKSYKKLIFTLSKYPKQPILTVDDDMYYAPSFIKRYWEAYILSDKRTVIGTIGRYEEYDNTGRYLPYSQWTDTRDANKGYIGDNISFYGCGGCLYPPQIFDEEIFNKKVFTSLAPTADDLWFWAMEKRFGIKRQLVTTSNKLFEPIDRIYMYKQEGTLTYINDIQKNNDIQLARLIKEYQL